MESKLKESDYLREYKCKYCDGTHCIICEKNKVKNNKLKINDKPIILYEEPRVK